MPKPIQRLKNPTKIRVEKYQSYVLAYQTGLISRTAAIKEITALNAKAPKRGITTYMEAIKTPSNIVRVPKPVPEQMPHALYDSHNITFDFGQTPETIVLAAHNALKAKALTEGRELRLLIKSDPIKSDPNIDKVIYWRQSYKEFRLYFLAAGQSDVDWIFGEDERIIILGPTPITAQRLFQHFRDGISHCVFVPLQAKIAELINNSESAKKQREYTLISERLKVLETQYKMGVPEDAMENIAKTAHMKIPMTDIFNNTLITYNENGKMATVYLQNTRFNHVDSNIVRNDNKPILVKTQEEINAIWMKAHNEHTYYDAFGNTKNGNVRKIKTIAGVYELYDEQQELFKKFSNSIGLPNYKFNSKKYPEVYKFLKAGTLIHSTPEQINDQTPTGHIDMTKAYAQFKTCHKYAGFMGVIHQWSAANATGSKCEFTPEFITKHIGIYKINILDNKHPLLQKLGLTSTHILPSVEILYFIEKGIKLEITEGVWGSRMDFEFTNEMLQKEDDVPHYAKWCGKLAMEINDVKHNIRASPEWAAHIKMTYPNLDYWEDKQIATISMPCGGSSTATHILAFITAYVRIQMLEQMANHDPEDITTVIMDGIYYKNEPTKISPLFVSKPLKTHTYFGNGWYSTYETPTLADGLILDGNTLLTGQGGCGKSYMIMNAPNFNIPLYVVPCHLLGHDGSEKYHCRYTTIHKLIGVDCVPFVQENTTPPVIFLDELTQYPADWVTKIFQMYKQSLIIVAGDIDEKGQWFQCRTGGKEFAAIWKPVNINIINITGDRRAKDDQLKALKLKVREEMISIFIDGDSGEHIQMKEWAIANLPLKAYSEAYPAFNNETDIWLAATHRVNNALLEKGVVSGYYKTGGKISKTEQKDYIKRGSMTIHSIQGKTIDSGKIYISIDDSFEYAMLYTAISRATTIDQLVFVV